MTMEKYVLVAGASGGTGQQIVRMLVQQGVPVRALVRDAGRATGLGAAEVAVGDTTWPETLVAALADVGAVICATGTRQLQSEAGPQAVDHRGVAHLAQAALDAGVGRFVLISSIAVTRPDHPLNRMGRVLDAKLAGENALRASGLAYTIIRPGGLTDDPGGEPVRFEQGDTMSGRISRADVAAVAVAALTSPAAIGTTFEIIADQTGTHDWSAAFAALARDAY